MSWNIVYTMQARKDLRDIYEYIALDLLVSETASRQTRRIMHRIRSLEEIPLRHQIYDEEPWYSQGIRCLPVDNYLIFYLPDESQNMVNIVRIMYSDRDVCEQLCEAITLPEDD